ncbi:hypothetical protein ACPEEZ_01350 [Frigoribacterium sp. 2-23]|uniref:hypothetical protein n=1 Tax=Frigoribacterium sp. 2-23 TaxID=3415006 RepID=UPI003C7032C0
MGRWTSDDGSLSLREVTLSGSTDDKGEARAYARPTALLGATTSVSDATQNGVDVVLPPIFALLSLGMLTLLLWAWGDLDTIRSRLRHR